MRVQVRPAHADDVAQLADVAAAIKEEGDYVASFTESGKVRDLGDPVRVEVTPPAATADRVEHQVQAHRTLQSISPILAAGLKRVIQSSSGRPLSCAVSFRPMSTFAEMA